MRKYLKFLILLAIAVFILWFFGRNLDWHQVRISLQKAQLPYIIAGAMVVSLGFLLRAKRWQVLLDPITRTSLKELFATTAVGFAAVFFVGRAGEIVRPMWLPMRDKRVRPSAALVTLGIERIFDLAALICFFSINLLWFEAPAGRERELEYIRTVGYLMLLGVPAGFAGLYVYHIFADRITKRIAVPLGYKWVPKGFRRIVLSLLHQLAISLNMLKDWREIASIVFWTFTLWLAIALPTWFVLLAFNLQLSMSDALFVLGFAALGSLVPTPGGAAGAFHMATAGGLIFLNVTRDEAAAAAIVMHLVYFAPAVIFGLYYFLRGDISVAGIKQLLGTSDPVEKIEPDETNAVAGT